MYIKHINKVRCTYGVIAKYVIHLTFYRCSAKMLNKIKMTEKFYITDSKCIKSKTSNSLLFLKIVKSK